MKHYVKLFSALSAGTLLGCAQWSLAPTQAVPVAASVVPAPGLVQVQPVERLSSPVSEVERLFILGRAAHSAGQLAWAEEYYRQVLNKQPAHLGALNSIGVIYAQTQRTEQAFEFFRQALELDPQASYVHNNLGYALLLAGRLGEAATELAQAHDLSPLSSQSQKNLELLARASEPAVAGPQLVVVGKNIYELRDAPTTLAAQTPAVAPVDLQAEKPATRVVADLVAKDQALNASLRGARIEVSNGVGIRYLARRTAERLAPLGVVTARLTNLPRYQQARTEIQFIAGQQAAALELSRQLPVAVRTVASAGLERKLQMRLVLGHDLVGKNLATWIESASASCVALASHDGWRWS